MPGVAGKILPAPPIMYLLVLSPPADEPLMHRLVDDVRVPLLTRQARWSGADRKR
jgi:hypothetical protein